MGILSILFSTRGRINRLQYWLGSIGVTVAMWVAFFIVGMMAISNVAPNSGKEGAFGVLITLVIAAFPILGVVSWCQMALTIKRLHDRGRTWLWSLLPFAVSMPVYFNAFGQAMSRTPSPNAGMGLYLLAVFAVSVWMFIDLGCLPGQVRPNKYGDSPNSGGSARPQQAAAPAQTAAVANSLFGAHSAMERAISERQTAPVRATAPAASASRAPAMAHAPPAPAGFGRKPAH